jgi:hypothetical protein
VEEATFLIAVQGIVGRIEVENDLLGRPLVRLEEEVDEQALDRRIVVPDLVVARGLDRCVLEPVQGALAGERRAVPALGCELAGENREHRIVAQLVVVDQVLIPERDTEHPLRHHRRDGMFDLRPGAVVDEARCEPPDQMDRPIGRAEQQPASLRGVVAAVERGHHLTALDHFITEQVPATLCRHRGAPLNRLKFLSKRTYRRFKAPMHLLAVRNPG